MRVDVTNVDSFRIPRIESVSVLSEEALEHARKVGVKQTDMVSFYFKVFNCNVGY